MTEANYERIVEMELLKANSAETIAALLHSFDLTYDDLAERLGVSTTWVKDFMGDANITLAQLASIGWALGIRFAVCPVPINREGSPAEDDPAIPDWVSNQARLAAGITE